MYFCFVLVNLFLLAPIDPPQHKPKDIIELKNIQFNDNIFFSSKELKKYLGIKNSKFFNHAGRYSYQRLERLITDASFQIQKAYLAKGFWDAEISSYEITDYAKGKALIFNISEGNRSFINTLQILGLNQLDSLSAFKHIQSLLNQPLSPQIILIGKDSLINYLGDQAYLEATVEGEAIPEENKVTFRIHEGREVILDSILIENKSNVNTKTISSLITLKSGQPIKRNKLASVRKSIFSLGTFEQVGIDLIYSDSTEAPVKAVLKVVCSPNKHKYVEAGLGIDSEDRIRSSFHIENRNFRRVAEKLSIDLKSSLAFNNLSFLENVGILKYQQPIWLINNLSSDYTFEYDERIIPEVLSDNRTSDYTQRQLTLAWLVKQQQSEKTVIWNEMKIYQTSFSKFDSLSTLTGQPFNRIAASINAGYRRDTRDNFLTPKVGTNTSLQLSLLKPEQGYFLKPSASLRSYKTYNWMGISARIRGGYIQPLTSIKSAPIEDRFRLGGASSLRGMAQDFLGATINGGDYFGGFNFDFRFPIWSFIGGTLLSDGGYLGNRDHKYEKALSYGGGIRLTTPLGPIRLDCAYATGQPHAMFHLSLGEAY
jgi:outer membrane protein assembly factor BamA